MIDQRPNFTLEEAKSVTLELFNISGEISSLPSERDQNFLIQTNDSKRFILKIANLLEAIENLDLQNNLISHISTIKTFNYPKLIEKDNKTIFTYQKENKSYFIRLLTFVEGIPFAKHKPKNKTFFFQYGKFLAQLTLSMSNFQDYPDEFASKEFHWDSKFADTFISKYKSHIKEPKKLAIVNHFQNLFMEHKSLLELLPKSIIHNDTNDYNIMVSYSKNEITFGIIDFGDTVFSHTIINLAVGIAYAILDKPDPILVISQIINGYNEITKLSEPELKVLFSLITIRLTLSVCISAYQQTIEPENTYLVISEKPAWLTLILLKTLNPTWVELVIRNTCGYTPHPSSTSTKIWLNANRDLIHPLIVNSSADYLTLDLSLTSYLGNFEDLQKTEILQKIIQRELEDTNKKVAITHSGIRVDFTNRSTFFQSNESLLFKNYVTTIDFYSLKTIDVFLPFDGIIFKLLINSNNLFTIIFEHQFENTSKFYSIISNIEVKDLDVISMGSTLLKGSLIGCIRSIHEQHYPLKYQILCIDDLSLLQESYLVRDKEIVNSIYYSSDELFRHLFNDESQTDIKISDLESKRMDLLGPSLSISYKKPLYIVRGYMQYLFDEFGNRYLDAVNNVPHVGHNNVNVVNALINQSKILNTNTRYLHGKIIELAEKLTGKLPDKLKVCFFVNSGSEANELALRLAENFTNKKEIAVLNHAYHGNTSKLIEISPYKHNGPGGKGTPDYVHILDLPDPFRGKFKHTDPEAGLKYASEAIEIFSSNKNIGTFIFESYPGVAGQIVLSEGYLKKVSETIQKEGVVCIADEVQIGLGRVGTHFWGFETHNVLPDIVTIGKPFGNGHPIGAVITTKEIADSFNNGMEYFNTFGGNPVSCSVALSVLNEIKSKNLQKNALEVGYYLTNLLLQLKENNKLIGDVRGSGLYIGLELVRNNNNFEPADWEASYIVERLKEMDILTSVDGYLHNVIKIKPPLVFTKENAYELVTKLGFILQESIFN